MSPSIVGFAVRGIAVCALALLAGGLPAAGAQEPGEAAGPDRAAGARTGEAAVLTALAETTEVDFQDVPLAEALAHLEERHGIEIEVDAVAVEESGATIDSPASLAVRGITLRSALNHLLRPHGLTWTIEHDLLTVTSQEAAEALLHTRVYSVSDLLTANPESPFDADNMIELLTSLVVPQTWSEVGGPGSIAHVPSGLAVSQTMWVHEEIVLLLGDLRRITAGEPPRNADAATIAITAALQVEVDAVYSDVPLHELLAHLSQEYGIPVLLDRAAIEEAGATADSPASIDVRGVSLRSALELILHRHGLTWVIEDEVLIVTSLELSEVKGTNRIYPVSDILAKGFENSYRIDDLSDTIQTIVNPQSWNEVGGPGDVYTYPGTLIVNQTPRIHEEIDALLAMLRELPAEEFPQQAGTRLKVYTVAGADPGELAGMIRQTIDWRSWLQHNQNGEGSIQAVRALPPAGKKDPAAEELAEKTQPAAETPPAELPQFGGMALPTSAVVPSSGWLLIQQSRENHERIESLLRQMGVLQQNPAPYGGGGFFKVSGN